LAFSRNFSGALRCWLLSFDSFAAVNACLLALPETAKAPGACLLPSFENIKAPSAGRLGGGAISRGLCGLHSRQNLFPVLFASLSMTGIAQALDPCNPQSPRGLFSWKTARCAA